MFIDWTLYVEKTESLVYKRERRRDGECDTGNSGEWGMGEEEEGERGAEGDKESGPDMVEETETQTAAENQFRCVHHLLYTPQQ